MPLSWGGQPGRQGRRPRTESFIPTIPRDQAASITVTSAFGARANGTLRLAKVRGGRGVAYEEGGQRYTAKADTVFVFVAAAVSVPIAAGASVSAASALPVLVTGASSGIGHMITDSQALLNTGQIIFGIILIGVIGLVSDLAFKEANRALFRWHAAGTAQSGRPSGPAVEQPDRQSHRLCFRSK